MRTHRNPRPKVPKQPPADNPPRRLTKAAIVAVEDSLDDLRSLIGKTTASVYAVEDLLEKIVWDDRRDPRDEEQRLADLGHLIDVTKETVGMAGDIGEEIASDLFRLRARPHGAKP